MPGKSVLECFTHELSLRFFKVSVHWSASGSYINLAHDTENRRRTNRQCRICGQWYARQLTAHSSQKYQRCKSTFLVFIEITTGMLVARV